MIQLNNLFVKWYFNFIKKDICKSFSKSSVFHSVLFIYIRNEWLRIYSKIKLQKNNNCLRLPSCTLRYCFTVTQWKLGGLLIITCKNKM